MNGLEVANLRVEVAGRAVVEDLSLIVRAGDKVGVVGRNGAGKTSLLEAMLFTAGSITRMGTVEDGNTLSDHDPDEQRRGISVSLAMAPVEWKGTKINVLDAPGSWRSTKGSPVRSS